MAAESYLPRRKKRRGLRWRPRPAAPLLTNLDRMDRMTKADVDVKVLDPYFADCLGPHDFMFNTPLSPEEMLGLNEYGSMVVEEEDEDEDMRWLDEMLRQLPPVVGC